MLTTKPRGTNDFLPGEVEKWQYLEGLIRELFANYHYKEIRTPIFEHTELFLRSVGETSDIVSKEMYSFEDKGLRHVTLRPEGTAGTVRAFVENKLFAQSLPVKLYYIGPMFRYDQPQAGRYRQFHQFGCEVLGSADPMVDAEVIRFAVDLFTKLGLESLSVLINTVGCDKCRPRYHEALREYFSQYKDQLCPTCLERLDKNPLRILDCKEESCKAVAAGAPTTLDYACDDCKAHFEKVCSYLESVGIKYDVDTTLVRGLDYYTQTAFEVIMNKVGSQQNAICGGGRYNKLVSQVGDAAKDVCFKLTHDLRANGFTTETDYLSKSMKAQMKAADKAHARYTVIIGDDELANGQAVVRNMATSSQETISLEEVINYVK